MALKKKNNRQTIIILTSLAVIVFLGIIFDVITFNPPSKTNIIEKSDKCYQKLKKKLSKQELMAIFSKKKMNQSFCEFL